jgi:hypothetical protein
MRVHTWKTLLQIQFISFIIMYVRPKLLRSCNQVGHTLLHRCQCVQAYSQWLIIFTATEKYGIVVYPHIYTVVIVELSLRSTIHSMQRRRESAQRFSDEAAEIWGGGQKGPLPSRIGCSAE